MAELSPAGRTDLSELIGELGGLAAQINQPTPGRSATGRRRRGRGRWVRRALLVIGLCLIAAGIAVIAVPLIGVWQRGRTDDQALTEWKSGGSQALVGGLSGGDAASGAAAQPCGGSGSSLDAYALVSFPSLKYGYAGVAGDGTWDQLKQRSMVHYRSSPNPGEVGNVIIGFHREPHYEHIDELAAGDVVTVQDRSCHLFHYTITGRWTLAPDQVTQLVPTTGHDLTLVTCTPFWQDTERIVWRATLSA